MSVNFGGIAKFRLSRAKHRSLEECIRTELRK